MTKKLFVAGLPYSFTSDDLNKLFSEFGKVISAEVIIDKYSGQSKGFGFVEMEDDKEAEEAKKKLNDSELEGRKIIVNDARPREDRPRYDNRDSDRGHGGSRSSRR